MDLCTREIVVCETSTIQDLHLAMRTLEALGNTVHGPALLHSNQGVLYTSPAFVQRKGAGLEQSWSRRGNCWDNALIENWNCTLKTEWLYNHEKSRYKILATAETAAMEIRQYCAYYNDKLIRKI
jgi:putative transposase